MNKPAPLATLLFLAYNQQDFVAQAALSCLEQQCEALEIIFSDDFSTDDTFAILQEIARNYHGPHQVTVRQNPHNLGIADHVNRLVNHFERCAGHQSCGRYHFIPTTYSCRSLAYRWLLNSQNNSTHLVRLGDIGTGLLGTAASAASS